ncbi:SANT/Myb-like DNA-binding domain-containing protein [Streptomyces sp. MAR25Y5]|uniref:SANT/Myb-like DNA-binding domain-containing protein n=1 Tax=Streptomyces sp. MAR25Y5 TaxID=2962028 RepID=UPI0020B82CB3|nr:SANT/Myb-like DNA-binding domain-containing protein [Streptomyces sp. MAR25Y5]MCP3769239.1 SANT/Myb-like DNA-binding domain-containing protein [Streptomyces sp. MAR25Y5]
MGDSTVRTAFRPTFTDYHQDPDDSDVLRRAVTVQADRITFDDAHLNLWLAGTHVGEFPLDIIESVCPQGDPGRRRESPEKLRARCPRMGHSWSQEDDAHLLALYRRGERDFDTLGKQFGRKPSAVRSRLAKLGLESLA